MKKRVLKIVGISRLAFVLLLGITVGWLYIYSKNYTIPEQAESIENKTGLIKAHGRTLYDANGKPIQLKGVNAGQILLQEGYMSPFATEPKTNPDGSYVTDADGNVQYPEFGEEDFRNAIKSNPNLNMHHIDGLMLKYWESFFTEEDFEIIKEDLGMNCIRLPFYYLNILNEDLTRKNEEDAFRYLDWFIGCAAKYELYVILDLHGAPGSQNGYEHSGVAQREAGLWDSEENVAATVDLWTYVARHYTETRPDLGKWIASYDLLNEPTYTYKGTTTKQCWAVFDRIYDEIRNNGDSHVITFCCCWDFAALPDPSDYGWENVQYQYHWYNWRNDLLPYDLFYAYQDLSNIGRDYDVPVLIGEFTAFEDRDAWNKMLSLYDSRGYNWTIWNYKTTVTGWWTSSWGVYTAQLKFITENEELKCNVSTCTYEEFIAACEKTRTENCATGTLYEVLKAYMGK
jgi:hypothetical protein